MLPPSNAVGLSLPNVLVTRTFVTTNKPATLPKIRASFGQRWKAGSVEWEAYASVSNNPMAQFRPTERHNHSELWILPMSPSKGRVRTTTPTCCRRPSHYRNRSVSPSLQRHTRRTEACWPSLASLRVNGVLPTGPDQVQACTKPLLRHRLHLPYSKPRHQRQHHLHYYPWYQRSRWSQQRYSHLSGRPMQPSSRDCERVHSVQRNDNPELCFGNSL